MKLVPVTRIENNSHGGRPTEEKRRLKRREDSREGTSEGTDGPGLRRRWLRNQRGLLTLLPRSRIPRVPDSGIDTGRTCGPGLARVSWVPGGSAIIGKLQCGCFYALT